jgi:hypothetical protein
MITHNEILQILDEINNKFAENGMHVTFKSEDSILIENTIFGGVYPINDTETTFKIEDCLSDISMQFSIKNIRDIKSSQDEYTILFEHTKINIKVCE